MQAIDTNILIYAEIRSSPHHQITRKILTDMADGAVPWAIPSELITGDRDFSRFATLSVINPFI